MALAAVKKKKKTRKIHEEIIKIGTWNVRSTYEEGALKNIAEIMKKYSIHIMALQETNQKGKIISKVGDYTFFNSGSSDSRRLGVGFMVNRKVMNSVVDFEAISERYGRLRIQGKYRKISIINGHAPTEDKDLAEKYDFYEKISNIVEKIPRYDVKIFVGDMNAKVGREPAYRKITGGNSRHPDSNENGKCLIEFATEEEMKIVSTSFQHKDIHKTTWISPDGRTRNQIDHVIIENRDQHLVKDVRSYRGADADSDHILVIAKVKQQLPIINKTNESLRKYNVEKMYSEGERREVETRINEELNNNSDDNSLEEEWTHIETVMRKVADQELLEVSKRKQGGWYDKECQMSLEKRQKARIKAMTDNSEGNRSEYRKARKETKKLLRRTKRKYMENKLRTIEENFVKKELRNFYQEAKKTQNSTNVQVVPGIEDKNGQRIYDIDGKKKIWKQYFEELLNVEATLTEDIHVLEEFQNEDPVEEPSDNEIIEQIRCLKNNKSAGENGIPAEVVKYGGQKLQSKITKLIQKIWRDEEMPDKWKVSLLCPVHKKGDKSICSHYRGISLLDVVYKVLARVIRRRLQTYENLTLGEYQGGFREGRGTIDQIFGIKTLMSKSYEQNLSLHMLFIDFRQAYDSIQRQKLYEALNCLGVPRKLINLIKMTLKGTHCRVVVDGKLSEKFEVRTGLKQGDPMSTTLFNLVLEKVIRDSKIQTNGLIYQKKHQVMAYADDVVLLTRSKQEMRGAFEAFEESARRYGLMINEDKTKYMVLKQDVSTVNEMENFRTKERIYRFARVKEFEYLGVLLTSSNDEEKEIQRRITKGSRAMGALNRLLRSKELSRTARIRIYETIIRPTVLYGCDTWILTKRSDTKLEAWERKMLRRIFGGIKADNGQWRRRTNQEIQELYAGPSITKIIRAQRTRWLGHVERMTESRHTKRILFEGEGGPRKRGRPRKKWLDAVLADIGAVTSARKWRLSAKNRVQWKRIVKLVKNAE